MISRADKGNMLIVLSKINYNKECYRQLENIQFYEKDSFNRSERNKKCIQTIQRKALQDKIITKEIFNKLSIPTDFSYRKFYILPKIHKPKEKWADILSPPGRPIVSNVNSEFTKISDFIVSYLSPLLRNYDQILYSTSHFLSKIGSCKLPDFPCFLFTADVESLYTNMEIPQTLSIIEHNLNKYFSNNPQNEFILTALSICLYNNNFYFDGSFYTQRRGIAMGSKFAPLLANLFMAFLEDKIFENDLYKTLIKYYCRFIDDCFGVFTGSMQQFIDFTIFFNSLQPGIKLNFTCSYFNIQFLDVIIFVCDSELHSAPFIKATSSLALIDPESNHSTLLKRNVIQNELLRGIKNSSFYPNFLEFKTLLFTALLAQGYSRRTLRDCFKNLMISNSINIQHDFIQFGSKPCNCCSFCNFIKTGNFININGKILQVVGHFNCNSSNVIYLIYCQKCNINYIGETKNPIKMRISQHFYDIKKRSTKLKVSEHFSLNHNIEEDFRILILKSNVFWTDNKRQEKERNLIVKYNTVFPAGLNEKVNGVSTNFTVVPFIKKLSPSLTSVLKDQSVSFTYNNSLCRMFHHQKF